MITEFRQSIICYLLLSLFLTFSSTLYADQTKTLYFYNPEVNTARNTILKGTFDKYLVANGGYQLQPVMDHTVFESLLLSHQAEAFIMSSQHFTQLVRDNPRLASVYLPILQGEKKGSDVYFKLLVSSVKKVDFSEQVLASSRHELASRSLIKRIFPNIKPRQASALKVLEVPKDIDALMAVGFGLADIALTNEDSLSTLSALYKAQYQHLHVVGKSLPQKRMVLILSNSNVQKEPSFSEVVYNMPDTSVGLRAMKLLGLDSWRRLSKESVEQGGEG